MKHKDSDLEHRGIKPVIPGLGGQSAGQDEGKATKSFVIKNVGRYLGANGKEMLALLRVPIVPAIICQFAREDFLRGGANLIDMSCGASLLTSVELGAN